MNKEKTQAVAELEDDQLVKRIKQGEIQLFRTIIKKYNQRLYRIAVSYGINDMDCDDLIQKTYVGAFQKLDQFEGRAKFSTWLTKILINECLMFKRNQKTKRKIFANFAQENLVTISYGAHQNPERLVVNKEMNEILEIAIKKLPDKLRSVYIMKEIENMSVKEIAESLSISIVNVKVRLHRAKSMLKDRLTEIINPATLFSFGNERCDDLTDNVMKKIIDNKKTDFSNN